MKVKYWEELKDKEKKDINILENNYFENIYDSNPNIKFLFIKKLGKIVGYVSYIEYDEFNDIVNIIVGPKYRLRGYGTKLLEGLNYKNISLEVSEENKNALNLYRKIGFKEVRIIQNYYVNNKAAYVMHKINL